MKCIEIDAKLAEFALGELSEEVGGIVAVHLEDCARCMEKHRKIVSALQSVDSLQCEEPPKGLAQRTIDALRLEQD